MQIEPNAATAGRPNEPTCPKQALTPSEAILAIAKSISGAGFTPPPDRTMVPGKVIRFPTGKNSRDDAGWLIIFDDWQGAMFGDFRTNQRIVWHARRPDRMTTAQKAVNKRRLRDAISQRDRELAASYETGAREAAAILNISAPVNSRQPYICRKKTRPTSDLRSIQAYDLAVQLGYSPTSGGEQLEGEILVVPYRGLDGALSTLEFIDPAGRKASLRGGQRGGKLFTKEPLPAPNTRGLRIFVAEGVATVLTCIELDIGIIVGVGSAGNLKPVGRLLRERYPDAEIVILGERNGTDRSTSEKSAREAAASINGLVVFPDLGPEPPENATDFNDMAALVGVDATRAYLLASIESSPPPVAPPSGGGGNPPAPPAGGADGKPKRSGPTEDCIARSFVHAHRDDLRYDHTCRRWYRFNGRLWQLDQVGTVQEDMRRHVRNSGAEEKLTYRNMSNILSLTRTDPLIAVTGSRWDADPYLLGTPDGVVDLRTKAYVRNPRESYTTKTTLVAPADGEPRRWLEFLHEAAGGDGETVAFQRRWLGYCLTGDVCEQVLVFIYGDGGSGKGVFTNTMLGIVGTYGYAAPINMFAASKFDQHPTSMADLQGRRFIVASETKRGARWAEEQVKWLTGGDRITARRMRADFFTYDPTHKITIVGNHAPALDATDNAMKRRLRVVPFDQKPARQDAQLVDKLAAEAPQILNWILDGCLEWQRLGLSNPPKIKAATDAYFELQDQFGDWCRACCDTAPDAVEPTEHLLASWNNFRRNHGEPPENEKSLVERLRRAGFTAGGDTRAYCEDGRRRVGRGLRLRVASSSAPMLF